MGQRGNRRTCILLFCFLTVMFQGVYCGWGYTLENGSGNAGQYVNLTAESGGTRVQWNVPPDETYLTQTSNRAPAQAVYKISNKNAVTISLYSRYASFATQNDEGIWVRGYVETSGGEVRLSYSVREDEVYLDGMRMEYDASSGLFTFCDDTMPSGLVDYGLNVYWSEDGNSYQKADCWLTDVSVEMDGGAVTSHYFETYEAEIDTAARYLKVVLYDQASIRIVDRADRYSFSQKGGLALASVEVDGDEPSSSGGSSSEWFPDSSDPNSGSIPDDNASSDWWVGSSQEEITETLPKDQPLSSAFSEQPTASVSERSSSASASSSTRSSQPKSTGNSGKPGKGGEVLQGGGSLGEEAPAVIRPESLAGEDGNFLYYFCTPEGLAVLFFSLMCIILAVQIFVKNEK